MDAIPAASGIYRITCIPTGKIYIGSALDLRHRRNQHFAELRRSKHPNSHLQRAWDKYGPDVFTFEVLEFVLPISLTAREQYWLNKLKPFDKQGYNMARQAGSAMLGRKHTPETREKMRVRALGNTRGLGQKLSPERREHLSQTMMGNTHGLGTKMSPETIAKRQQSRWGKKHIPDSL